MICAVVKGPTWEVAHVQIEEALVYADLIELRLDCFFTLDLTSIKKLRSLFAIPMIFTLRSSLEGGSYQGSEDLRLKNIHLLASLEPEYLDLESFIPTYFIESILSRHPKVKLIISYHNFKETPEDLDHVYENMQKIPAYFYKIAVMAHSGVDALRLLQLVRKASKKLIGVSMGEYGQFTRIIAPILGSAITYGSLEEKECSLGQFTIKTLMTRYRVPSLTENTAIYALLGDPVDGSISDITHNRFFASFGLNAVYVKIRVRACELTSFLSLLHGLPFLGFSITMPLKEAIIPFLDAKAPEVKKIKAANTLVVEEGKLLGFNTDGIGALDAIEKTGSIKGKRVLVLGAGGASRAIVFEAVKRGAFITVFNRSTEKAKALSEQFGCLYKDLESFSALEESFEILINTTSIEMTSFFDFMRQDVLVMDIRTKPKETPFLVEAKKRGCLTLYGYEMFAFQAMYQFSLWFKCLMEKDLIQDSFNLIVKEVIFES